MDHRTNASVLAACEQAVVRWRACASTAMLRCTSVSECVHICVQDTHVRACLDADVKMRAEQLCLQACCVHTHMCACASGVCCAGKLRRV